MSIEKVTQLPEEFQGINPHNLYLYAKAYLANLRAGTAHTKTRSDVKGGGKKPWRQKGTGRARAGSITSPVFVGGGVAHGPRNTRNWSQKINKKQRQAALRYALNEKAQSDALFVVDSIKIESGKTKDAVAFLNQIGARDYLVVVDTLDEKTFLAFRNIPNAYIIEINELNAYDVASFYAVVFEKSAWQKVIKG
ncbi:MAG: 50S ribosomal protein L4 [Epsilonproteobacteria bacterium]|nr:50S ribosomal protein L4 [Campylobacterota bacterium]